MLTHFISKGTRSRRDTVTKFWCDDSVLRAEFARWAATDIEALEAKLDTIAYEDAENKDSRHIKDVPKSGFTPKDPLQFLCLDEWNRIIAQSTLRSENGVSECLFEEMDKKKDSAKFRVSGKLLHELLAEKRAAVRAPQNIMDLSGGLTLHLQPVHGSKKQSDDLLAAFPKDAPPDTPLSYSCVVHIRYCVAS